MNTRADKSVESNHELALHQGHHQVQWRVQVVVVDILEEVVISLWGVCCPILARFLQVVDHDGRALYKHSVGQDGR